MQYFSYRGITSAVIAAIVIVVAGSTLSANDQAALVDVQGGTATFEADTNIRAIRVHGRSTAMKGRARIRHGANGLTIDDLRATIPVKTLTTGLELRDEHMRKRIFMTPDGQLPDLEFSGSGVVCTGSGERAECRLSGQLTIRGTAQPFAIAVTVTRQGNRFRVMGDGLVKLSAWGIPQPSQLGVTTLDDVKLHLELVAIATAQETLLSGVQQ